MNRPRSAGLIFLGIVAVIVLGIVVVLTANRSRGLRFTVIFGDGKQIRVGDRVQFNGVDIGEVDSVALDRSGKKVFVRLKIQREHAEKILANSTAYISDSTFPNVSGQKVIEVYNSANGGGPIRPNAQIEGKDSLIQLKSWQAKENVLQWGKDIQEASKDWGGSAKQLTDDARKAVENFARGVKESFKETPGAKPPDQPDAPRENISPRPIEPPKPRVSPGELSNLARRLGDFLGELGAKGKEGFAELNKKWQELKKEVVPMLQRLKEQGGEALRLQLENIMNKIERALERMRQERDSREPPAQPTPAGAPVPI